MTGTGDIDPVVRTHCGRSAGQEPTRPPLEAPSLPSSSPLAGAEQRRIEELERKIGQQQLDLDFFRTALRHVGEQRLKKGGPGGRASSR